MMPPGIQHRHQLSQPVFQVPASGDNPLLASQSVPLLTNNSPSTPRKVAEEAESQSSGSSNALPTFNIGAPGDSSNELVYAPALVKPSQLKNRAKLPVLPVKPNVRFDDSPSKAVQKPALKKKPNAKDIQKALPPAPAKKPGRLTVAVAASYEKVDVETSA